MLHQGPTLTRQATAAAFSMVSMFQRQVRTPTRPRILRGRFFRQPVLKGHMDASVRNLSSGLRPSLHYYTSSCSSRLCTRFYHHEATKTFMLSSQQPAQMRAAVRTKVHAAAASETHSMMSSRPLWPRKRMICSRRFGIDVDMTQNGSK